MKYSPDIGSTKHRWSWTFFERSSVMMPLRCTMPSRTMTPRPLGTPVLHAERIDDAATNVIVVGCRIGGLAGKACDRYDTNLSKEN